MTRFEIITNQSVETDLIELLDEAHEGIFYTIIPGVLGRGRQGERRGDPVWPEKNALVIVYTENETQRLAVLRAVRALKRQFPSEGIKMFFFELENQTS